MNAEQHAQIEALYREMYDKLVAYACCGLDNISLAEEAVQETFHLACQMPEKVCGSPNPQGWLVLTLRNTVRNIRSNQAGARKLLERYMLSQQKELFITDDGVRLNVLYENLADTEEFKLLSEMAVAGRSHEEMAAARGITVAACKKRVQRAKEVLQRKIKI